MSKLIKSKEKQPQADILSLKIILQPKVIMMKQKK